MATEIMVTKANGDRVPFSPEKVKSSMQRANVPQDLQETALKHIEENLREGMTTREIYRLLFNYLKSKNRPAAAKYSLKRAIMALGPSGYPFEKFLARLFKALGYETETNVLLTGECTHHEIDVIASKEGEKLLIEAKFHNRPGIKTDIQTLLYVYARFLDCRDPHHFTSALLATNTKVTSQARKYAKCRGLKILSWNYPEGRTLPQLIEKAGLHPITECLELGQKDREELLQSGIVTCRDLSGKDLNNLTKTTHINPDKLLAAQEESRGISGKL